MFMPFTMTQDTPINFMTVSFSLWLGYSLLMIKQSLSFGDVNSHHSDWLESVSPPDRHGRDALDFAICRVGSSWFAVPLILLVTDWIL